MAENRREETTRRAGDDMELVLRGASTHDTAERLTDRVYEFISKLPLDPEAVFRLKLAAHETLTNAIEHGNRNDPSRQVTLTCRRRPHEVAIIIEDEGDGFDPDGVPDPTAQENLLKEGGRGILLIRSYVDECRFENHGRRIVLIKRFS